MATRRIAPPPADELPAGMPAGADPDAWRMMVAQQGGGEVIDPDDEAEQEIGDKLRDAFGVDRGANARVAIYRRDARTKELEFCCNYTPDQFIEGGLELVKQDLGPGSYEFRAYGSRGLIPGCGRGLFKIAEPRLNPSAVPSAAQGETAQLMRLLVEGQQAMLAKLSEPAPTPPPAPSLLQQLGVTSLAEALTLAGTLKGLLAPAQSSDPMEAMVKAMGMIRTLRETADEINPPPPAGDPDNPISLIPSFLEVIKTGMQQQGGAAPTTIPTLALPNSVATAHDTVPQRLGDPAEVNNSEDEMQDIMNRALDMFARNETAEAVGNYLYEYLPDEAMSLLAQPNWLDMLLSFAPQFEPHRAKLIEAHKVIGARVAGAKRNG